MKPVLALQHYWDDPPGYLGEIMEEHGIAYDVINVEESPIPDPANYAAVFTLGGPQSASAPDKHPYMVQEKAFLRHLVEQDIPFLGICLGGQLLASALRAPVTRHHTYEIGFYEVQLTDEGKTDPLYQGLPGYQQVIHWHEDTFDVPTGAIKLASSENTPNQAFRVGRRAYGLQYHIEVSPAMLDIWFGYPDYKKLIGEVLGPDGFGKITRDRATRYPIYRQHTRTLFENFLKLSECL